MFILSFALFSVINLSKSVYRNTTVYVDEYYDYLEDQTRLSQDLFANYDATISPVYTKPRDPSKINDSTIPSRYGYYIFVYYLKLVEIDEPQEKVSIVGELMEHWSDPRLAWDPANYSNIDSFYARQDRVWSPTISVFGVNELTDFRDPDFRLVRINNVGEIYDYLSIRIAANCPLNVYRFPFDTQKCQFRFCIPIFNRDEVAITGEIYSGILTEEMLDTMGNSEWRMVNLSYSLETLEYSDSFGSLDFATIEIQIQRNPMYYMYMIVFPAFIINFLSIIGVFIKGADKMSRLNVGLTNIMTMTFILGVMADKIPKTGTIPALGVYIILNLSIMVLAISAAIGITELRKWAMPKLKLQKSQYSRWMEKFLGNPVEYTTATILLTLTTANFFLMIGFWIAD